MVIPVIPSHPRHPSHPSHPGHPSGIAIGILLCFWDVFICQFGSFNPSYLFLRPSSAIYQNFASTWPLFWGILNLNKVTIMTSHDTKCDTVYMTLYTKVWKAHNIYTCTTKNYT